MSLVSEPKVKVICVEGHPSIDNMISWYNGWIEPEEIQIFEEGKFYELYEPFSEKYFKRIEPKKTKE